MKKLIRFFASTLVFFAFTAGYVSAEKVDSLSFTALTRTEKVTVSIDSSKKTIDYFTPGKDFHYAILDYDYNADTNEKTYLFKATVVDLMLNTANQVTIFSNGTFTDMRIGRRVITFTHIEEFSVNNR